MTRMILVTIWFTAAVSVLAQTPATSTKAHTGLVHSLALSADGKLLASAGFDNQVKIWDITGTTLKEKAVLAGHTAPVYAVSFSPDGKKVISASADKTVRIWDLATKKSTTEYKGHADIVDSLALSSDGKTVASAGADKAVKLWNPADGKDIKALGTHGGSVYAVAYSKDGKTLASGGADNIIKLWDTATQKESKQLKGHEQAVTGLTFGEGKALISISLDRTIRVWDIESGKETAKLGPTSDDPYGVVWAADAKLALVSGYSGSITVWDIAAKKSLFTSKIKSPGYCIVSDPKAKVAFTGHDNGTIAVSPITIKK